jgi:hypothetical protein
MAIKLVTRAAWGARAYKLPSGATSYAGPRRGVKLHYLGSAYSDRPHDRCDDYVRQLQTSHMDGNGWSDIGYSFVVCTHGYVYEGRGLRRRNSANGSTFLNERDYAVCLLVGSSGLTKPTDAQLHGARDAIDYCREEGSAGTWLGGHRDGYATTCPGDAIYAWAKAGAPRPTESEENDMTPEQARQLKALYDVLTPYAGWDYKGKGETRDAYDYLRTTGRDVAALKAQVAGLTTVNKQLVDTVAQLAAGLGDLDPAAIVAELTQAIESVEVRLDVPDATPTS